MFIKIKQESKVENFKYDQSKSNKGSKERNREEIVEKRLIIFSFVFILGLIIYLLLNLILSQGYILN